MLQGIGFAFTLSLGLVIITSVFPGHKRGFVVGCYALAIGFAQAAGPTIGGIIVQYLNWRWLFFINIPLGIGSVVLLLKFYSVNEGLSDKESVDLLGAVLLTSGLIFVMFALNQISAKNFESFAVLGSFIIGFILLLVLGLFERKLKYPLIDFSLYHNRTYFFISIIRWISTYLFTAFLFIIPLYLQNILGYSPVFTGLILLIMIGIFAFSSPLFGKILDKIGYKKILIFSSFLFGAAFMLLSVFQINLNWVLLITSFIFLGLARAMMLPASISLAMHQLPKHRVGVGMGALYTFALFGGACGVSITGSLVSLFSFRYLFSHLKTLHLYILPQKMFVLRHIANGSRSVNQLLTYFSFRYAKLLTPIVKSGFIYGFSVAMKIAVLLSLIILILSIFVQEKHDQ